jgi:two-component system, cell cycle sensor histidine kinase PleC
MSEAREGALAALQPANDHTKERLTPAGAATTTAELMALVGESLLDALFGHGAPSYVAGISGELLYANAAYKRLANEAATELLPSHRRAVQRVRERGEAFMLHETLGSDETARTYTSRHFPIMAPDGGVAAIAATFNDATGETEARARARRERQRLQDVIRSTSDWVWEKDETGAISFVSDRVTEALGIPPLLVKGRPLIGIGRFVAPEAESAPAVLLGRRPFRDAPFEIEDRLGQTRRFHLSGVPVFDDTGRFLGYRGTASDVSERHAAEERARRPKPNASSSPR